MVRRAGTRWLADGTVSVTGTAPETISAWSDLLGDTFAFVLAPTRSQIATVSRIAVSGYETGTPFTMKCYARAHAALTLIVSTLPRNGVRHFTERCETCSYDTQP